MSFADMRERWLDAVLVATLVAVPLVFTTQMRSFAAAKLAVLEIGVGAALVLAAFVRVRIAAVGAGATIGVLAVGAAARPDVEGLAATAALAATAGLALLLAARVHAWSERTLVAVIAVPLAIMLAHAMLQGVGVGVLPASAGAFGGTHGRVVATVGNPVELTWALALGGTLLVALRPVSRRWLVVVPIAVVIVVDRARATAIALAVIVAVAMTWRRTPRAWLVVGSILAIAVVAALQWNGALALRGRAFLAGIGIDMLQDGMGMPQGAGAFARDFEAAQAQAIALHPTRAGFASVLDHAHCDAIELAYELGLLGVLALGWLVRAVLAAVRADPTPRRRAGAIVLALGVGLGLVGYPLFSPACATTMALALALVLARPDEATRRWPQSLALALVGMALVVVALRQARAELAMTAALSAHARGDDDAGLAHAERAVALFPGADAWFYLGNFDLARGRTSAAADAYRRSEALRPRAQTRANLARALHP